MVQRKAFDVIMSGVDAGAHPTSYDLYNRASDQCKTWVTTVPVQIKAICAGLTVEWVHTEQRTC